MTRRVCLLSLSAIADDPRVRRQGDALHAHGWDVVAVGLGGAAAPAPEWTAHGVEADGSRPGPVERVTYVGGHALVRLVPALAERVFWSQPVHGRILERARASGADLYVANDWPMLPVAARLASESGTRFVYDSHEHAATQKEHRWKWRLLVQRYVRTLERRHIGGAALVSTVCRGIADLLRTEYALERSPMVVRNVPRYEPMPFVPSGDEIKVLYHGAIAASRGLERLIESVGGWRPEFRLYLRGPGASRYVDGLKELAAARGVSGRVEFLPPVPLTALIREANAFDIGFFSPPGISQHSRFTLPNKIFEYIMAGLAVCVGDLPEMAGVVREHDVGRLVNGSGTRAIAEAINAFTRESIDAYKQRSLRAAKALCWEREQSDWLRALDGVVGMPSPGARAVRRTSIGGRR